MAKPLFTSKGFDRSAIMKRAWALFRLEISERRLVVEKLSEAYWAAFSTILRGVWADARRERDEERTEVVAVTVPLFDRCLRDAIGAAGPLKGGAKRVGVSRETFRFALDTLCERGLLDRFHALTAAGAAKRAAIVDASHDYAIH